MKIIFKIKLIIWQTCVEVAKVTNKLLPSRIKLSRYPKYAPLLIVLRQLLSQSSCLSWGHSTWLSVCLCEREREREREKERECQEVREREEPRESARELGREKIERERESWASDGRNDSEGDLQASRLAASSRRRVLQGDYLWKKKKKNKQTNK